MIWKHSSNLKTKMKISLKLVIKTLLSRKRTIKTTVIVFRITSHTKVMMVRWVEKKERRTRSLSKEFKSSKWKWLKNIMKTGARIYVFPFTYFCLFRDIYNTLSVEYLSFYVFFLCSLRTKNIMKFFHKNEIPQQKVEEFWYINRLCLYFIFYFYVFSIYRIFLDKNDFFIWKWSFIKNLNNKNLNISKNR